MSELPKGPKPGARDTSFFPDPMIDHLLRAVVTLTMELSVTRERLKSLESVAGIDSHALDSHQLTPQEEQARAAARRQLIEATLGPMVSRLKNLSVEAD
ncbi:MAG: hypothetical protein ACMVO5_02070 [Polymorphobacter sp.]|uniref:hypothetical protein n=1 Tax=Polymorphobacter sp. TaxID=1909290 RepID=UPI003A8C1BAA